MKNIIFILLLSSFTWAGIGNVGALKGNVDMIRDINTLKVQTGMQLEVKDNIITKERSRVQAILNDDTVVTIGPNSSFIFDAYTFGDKDKSKVHMRAERGFFRSVTGKIGKLAPKRFNIKTPSTTIGIRGTDFSAFISDTQEVITCHKGEISVLVGDKTYIVEEGQQLILGTSLKKKKSSSNIEIFNSIRSLEDIQNGVKSSIATSNNPIGQVNSLSGSMSALDQIDTNTLDEVNRKDAMPPLENPTVEFQDR